MYMYNKLLVFDLWGAHGKEIHTVDVSSPLDTCAPS